MCILTCTNPFRKVSWIKEAVETIKRNKKIDSAFSVHHLYKHFFLRKKPYRFYLDERIYL